MMSSVRKVYSMSSYHFLQSLAISRRSYLIYLCSLMRLISPRSGTFFFHLSQYFWGIKLTMQLLQTVSPFFFCCQNNYLTLSYSSCMTFSFLLVRPTALNCFCLSFISYFFSRHSYLGIATSPYDRKITTRNIPNAFEAAINTGINSSKSNLSFRNRQIRKIAPSNANTPQIIRLFMTAVFILSLRVNYPAAQYYCAMGSNSQVSMNIPQYRHFHTTLIVQSDCRE